jgi:hypothetical protein
MIPVNLAAALANHLWQSTVFAGIAGLPTLALRRKYVRTRYWLWLIASVKFLIPFRLLSALGSGLGWLTASRMVVPEPSVVMDQISQPFPQLQSPAVVAPTALAHPGSPMLALLLALWAGGFVAVACSWWLRWQRIRAAARAGSRLAAAGLVAVAGPIGFGLMNASQSRAQSPAATSAPRFQAANITPKFLLEEAYGVKDNQVSGAPAWLDSEHYDFEAKPEDSSTDQSRKLSFEERYAQHILMLQSLLADRFKLTLDDETKELPT